MIKDKYIDMIIKEKKISQELAKNPLDLDFYNVYFKYTDLVSELATYKYLVHKKDTTIDYWKRWEENKKTDFYHNLL